MVISGLVVVLRGPSPGEANPADSLRTDPRMTLGHAIGANLPLVMETEDARSAQVLVDEVREIPGVLHVDVAFIEIDPDDAASQPGSAFGRRRAGERPASDFPSAATCTFP